MATLQQLEQALINADKAGDVEGARVLAQAVAAARQSPANLIPGAEVPETLPQPDRPTIGQRLIGAGETGLTLATGATGGTVGTIAGTLQGLAQAILSGQYGTPEAVKLVEEAATQMGGRFTYQPRTQAGQEMVQSVGEVLQQVPPVLPVLPQLAATPVRPAATQARAATVEAIQPVADASARAVRPVVEAVGTAVQAVRPTPSPEALPGSVGAAATAQAKQRIETAQGLPVPFTGPAALTKGQATRNFNDLQFEKETAKLAEGAPLRERASNQTLALIQNFDALVDLPGPVAADKRDLGRMVDRALLNKVNVMINRTSEAYRKAREAGEMQQPVEMTPLSVTMADVNRFEGVSPNIPTIRREAIRIGALAEDADGNLIPQRLSIDDSELLIQFINQATDWQDPRQSLFARKLKDSIDTATEGAGGDLYKKARNMRKEFANEFENVGLTASLIGTKKGTTQRQVALEDVFDKIIVSSPIDETNKLRRTLLTAGPEGKQAWNDLKSMTVEFIKERAVLPNQRDEFNRPLISPAKLANTVRELDQDGKLVSLFGKKQAQILRDLAELSIDLYTAPPGAVNFSNTSSALGNAFDTIATFGLSGLPVAGKQTITELLKYTKNRETRKRIKEALQFEVK
jgi:hypothetical protein